MKKIFIVSSFAAVSVLLAYCCGPKKMAATPASPSVTGATEAPKVAMVPKSTFESGVSAAVMANCVPCHIPSKGGNKKPYDNFANVKADIDEIIRRIELNPTDRGFMPMRGQKLSDETIAVFKKWKADGLMEK
jgi:mono/diheme cytochrome c family protein